MLRANTAEGQQAQALADQILVRMAEAEMVKPVQVGDFTDFLTSIYHATNAGKIFNPDSTLGPNFKYMMVTKSFFAAIANGKDTGGSGWASVEGSS